MSISPNHLLYLATELLNAKPEQPNLEDEEAMRRAAVSRFYYAAYHCGIAFVYERGFTNLNGKGGPHRQLWRWFSSQDLGQIASLGHQLRDSRHVADYKLGKEFSAQLAQTCARRAEKLLEAIETSAAQSAL